MRWQHSNTHAEYSCQQGEDMQATLELFEQYKLRIGVHADSAGAAALGVKSQTVSNWRTRGSQAEPWLIEKMCVVLDVDTTEWLLRAQMEQSPNASNKLVWQRVGEKLGYRIASVGLLLTSPLGLLWRRLARAAEGFVFEVPQTLIAASGWLLASS